MISNGAPPDFCMDAGRSGTASKTISGLFCAELKGRKLDLSAGQHRLPCGQPYSGYPRELLLFLYPPRPPGLRTGQRRTTVHKIAVGCQGGGMHAAFEVGVLTEILKDCEKRRSSNSSA